MRNDRLITASLRAAAVIMMVLLGACGAKGGNDNRGAAGNNLAAGHYRAAYIEAKKILQRDGKNAPAWLLLGKATLMLGDPKQAVSDLQHADSNGVPFEQWAVPMARALLAMHQYDKLIKTVKPDDTLPGKTKVQVLVLRGDALLRLGTVAAAKRAYEDALGENPSSASALAGLANAAVAEHDLDSAGNYAKKALALTPDDPTAWMAKGNVAYAAGDFAAAEKAYDKAVNLKGEHVLPQDRYDMIARLADTQIQQNKLVPALAHIHTLEKMSPTQPYGHYLHAAADFKKGQWDDAISELQQVLKVVPDNEPAQLLMGAVNFAKNNLAQAEMYLSNVIGSDPKNAAARHLLALTLYKEGDSQQAVDVLRAGNGSQHQSDARLLADLRAEAAEGTRFFGSEMTPQSTAAQPVQAELGHAAKVVSSGNLEEAIRLLRTMPKGTGSQEFDRNRLLAAAYLRSGREREAEKLIEGYSHSHPKLVAGHVLYGMVLVAGHKYHAARREFVEANRLEPRNVVSLISLGTLDSLQSRFDDAQGRFEAALKIDPHNALALVGLGELATTQGKTEQAIQYLRSATQAAPKMAAPYLDLALIYSKKGNFPEAVTITQALLDKTPDDPAALNAVGAAQLNARHFKDALDPLQKAVKAAPGVPLYRMNLARAQILNHHFKAAEHNLGKVVSAVPNEVVAVEMLAFLKARDNDLKGALALANRLRAKGATRVAGEVLAGDLYMLGKDYGKADEAYTRALKSHGSRAVVFRVFQARKAENSATADHVLRSWLDKHPSDESARMVLGQYYIGRRKLKAAASELERVLKKYPDNVAALNDLGWLYAVQKDPKGLKYAKKAYKLAPKAYPIQDTYGWALVSAGNATDALPILQAAADQVPNDAEVHYHLAVAQARTGDTSGATETLREVLKGNAEFTDRSEAEKLYKELTQPSSGH